MKPLNDAERKLAETTARLIAEAEKTGLPDVPEKLTTTHAIQLLARAHVELRDQVRRLNDLADQPLREALVTVGLGTSAEAVGPRLVRTAAEVATMEVDQLLQLYCDVMRDCKEVFVKYESYALRAWDGMDGCWTDCTGEVGLEEALRAWAHRTDGGVRQVSYDEIDYCRIFPGGTRMLWDGADGREMHR